MKKTFKASIYFVFFLVVLFSFGMNVEATGFFEGYELEKECFYQYGVLGDDNLSSLKFEISKNGGTNANIIYFDGKGVNNLELSTNWEADGLDEKYSKTKRCPNFAMIADKWNNFHVYLAYNEEFLQDIANEKGYSNYFIEPLIDSNDNPSPDKPSNNQAYTSKEIENGRDENKDEDEEKDNSHLMTDSTEGCEALGPLLDDIKFAWKLIKIAAPILVIVFGSVDFAQAVISSDEKVYKNAINKFSKRLMFAAALFFLPYLVDLLFTISGINQGLESAICGIK